MQKINLSLRNVTAIPVTKALRAVKGDYILVREDGSTSVVPSAVFRAMGVLQDHSNLLGPRHTETSKAKGKYKYKHSRTQVWPKIKLALEVNGALTTSQLAKIINVPWGGSPTENRNYIGSICRRMKNELESVKVEGPNVKGQVRILSLWDLKNRTSLPHGKELPQGLGSIN